MERHAYHTYQILDHVEKTPLVTNRRVAGKLNVSVKLAHALLGQLVHKGLLHIRKRNARRWDYFLTPKGIAEKARLTYEFMDFTMHFYREARRRSAEALAGLRKQGVRQIAFLGASDLAEIAFLGVQDQKLRLTDVFDTARAGEEFLGLKVRPLCDLGDCAAERILVTAFDPSLPMSANFLPPEVAQIGAADAGRMVWVFAAPVVASSEKGNLS